MFRPLVEKYGAKAVTMIAGSIIIKLGQERNIRYGATICVESDGYSVNARINGSQLCYDCTISCVCKHVQTADEVINYLEKLRVDLPEYIKNKMGAWTNPGILRPGWESQIV